MGVAGRSYCQGAGNFQNIRGDLPLRGDLNFQGGGAGIFLHTYIIHFLFWGVKCKIY